MFRIRRGGSCRPIIRTGNNRVSETSAFEMSSPGKWLEINIHLLIGIERCNSFSRRRARWMVVP